MDQDVIHIRNYVHTYIILYTTSNFSLCACMHNYI